MAEFISPITEGDAGTKMGANSPEQDQSVIQKISSRWKHCKGFRGPFDAPWDRYRRLDGGDQWYNKLRPAWKARPVYNYIRAHRETVIPMMTENKPTINVVAKSEEWDALADVATDGLHSVFDENSVQQTFNYVLWCGFVYGTYISKQWFDPKANGGKGGIRITPIDTRYFYPSPGALDLETAEYVLLVANRWIPSIERDFPEAKGKITNPGLWDETLTHRPVDTQSQTDKDGAFAFPDSAAVTSLATQPTLDTSQMATQIEMWDRDEQGNVWVTIAANELILKRMMTPFKNGNKFPFARGRWDVVPSQFWGSGEVAHLESPQDSVNRSEAMILDLARMCTSPFFMVPRGSRVSTKDITNRVGGFVIYDGEIEPHWQQPPQAPTFLFQIVDSAKLHMDNMTGSFDASRGQLPAGKISGIAIQSLQAATSGRVGLKTRNFEEWLREVAIQSLDLMRQFYQNRTVRVGEKYVDLNKYLPTGAIKNDITAADFDVEIGMGSSLPVDKGARFDQFVQLRQLGDMSQISLIRATGVDDEHAKKIVGEIQKEVITGAKVQAKAQAVAAPPATAPPAGGPAPSPGEQDAATDPRVAEKAGKEMGAGADGMPSEEEIAQLEAQMGAQR